MLVGPTAGDNPASLTSRTRPAAISHARTRTCGINFPRFVAEVQPRLYRQTLQLLRAAALHRHLHLQPA